MKLKPLSAYVRKLEKAGAIVITDETVAATDADATTIIIALEHPEWSTREGRIDSVSHEIVHQVHTPGIDKKPREEQQRLEEEVLRLTKELRAAYPAWDMLALDWLATQFYDELTRANVLATD